MPEEPGSDGPSGLRVLLTAIGWVIGAMIIVYVLAAFSFPQVP
jgi:phage shock protein PspC (stress-responsive transcriptional regulator)